MAVVKWQWEFPGEQEFPFRILLYKDVVTAAIVCKHEMVHSHKLMGREVYSESVSGKLYNCELERLLAVDCVYVRGFGSEEVTDSVCGVVGGDGMEGDVSRHGWYCISTVMEPPLVQWFFSLSNIFVEFMVNYSLTPLKYKKFQIDNTH